MSTSTSGHTPDTEQSAQSTTPSAAPLAPARTAPAWRSGASVRTALVAAASAGVFLGAYDLVSGTAQEIAAHSPAVATTTTAAAAEPFTAAQAGDCVTWDVNTDGSFTNFETASCADPHRFEVAIVEDLGVYPTSEFGRDAAMPSLERQAELREELCQGSTLAYLNGQFDPAGRFSIAPILPPEDAWAAGDRTMLCGLQTTNEAGIPQLTQGRVADGDQANLAAPGECRAIGEDQVLRTVDCAQPHQLETVSVVSLAERFPDGFPPIEEQDAFLAERCAQDAIAYLGDEEALYQSTLQPYWGTVAQTSWTGGTYSVNCSLMHADPATTSFSTITGTAKDGRDGITINGAPPAVQPERNPLRDPNAGAVVPGAPGATPNDATPGTPGL